MAGDKGIRAGKAFVELFADNSQLKRTLRTSEKDLKAFGTSVSRVGRQLAAIGLAGVTGVVAATRVFANFDDQMRLTAAVTQATAKQFENMTQQAKELGRTTSFTAAQVAGAMVELGRAGFAVQEIQNATPHILNLARATKTELADAARLAAATLRMFNMEASETERVADVLVVAANRSAATLEELGESMKFAGPVAREFGMTIEETAKTLGVLANFGIKGSMAGTSFRAMMVRLADPTVRKEIESMGIALEEMTASGMEVRNISAILADLGDAMADMSDLDRIAKFNELFNRRALTSALSIATADFHSLNDAIDAAAGTANRTARAMDAGIGGVLRRLMSAVEGNVIALGEGFAPVLSRVAGRLVELSGKLSRWIEQNRDALTGAAKLAAKILALGVGLMALGKIIVAVGATIGVLRAVVFGIVPAIKAFGAALSFLAANPLILIAAGIAALILVSMDWGKVLGGIVDKLSSATGALFSFNNALNDTFASVSAQNAEMKNLAKRLVELREKQEMSTDEMIEAANIVEQLKSKMPELADEIDALGTSADATAAAFETMSEKMREALLAASEAELGEMKERQNALEKELTMRRHMAKLSEAGTIPQGAEDRLGAARAAARQQERSRGKRFTVSERIDFTEKAYKQFKWMQDHQDESIIPFEADAARLAAEILAREESLAAMREVISPTTGGAAGGTTGGGATPVSPEAVSMNAKLQRRLAELDILATSAGQVQELRMFDLLFEDMRAEAEKAGADLALLEDVGQAERMKIIQKWNAKAVAELTSAQEEMLRLDAAASKQRAEERAEADRREAMAIESSDVALARAKALMGLEGADRRLAELDFEYGERLKSIRAEEFGATTTEELIENETELRDIRAAEIAAGADEAGREIETRGTFSAFAVGALGTDSVATRTAEATEETAENTKSILSEAKRSRLRFS